MYFRYYNIYGPLLERQQILLFIYVFITIKTVKILDNVLKIEMFPIVLENVMRQKYWSFEINPDIYENY